MSTPRRRSTDRRMLGFIPVNENFYRDIWLFVITFFVLLSALQTQSLVNRIQAERARNVRENCLSQNARNRATLAQLDALIAQLDDGPRKNQALQGRAGTILLISTLAPYRDCEALVRAQVSSAR